MHSLSSNVRGFVSNYLLKRVGGLPAASMFWYLPEPPRVFDGSSLDAYRASATPSPLYLMDYRRKLEYSVVGENGMIVLNYGPPIGLQVNPEASFQYALACHDEFARLGNVELRHRFLQYAAHFRAHQEADGLWLYRFAWYRSPNPWYSVLSQTRGASVMLRAYLLTGETSYRDAALAAIARLDEPTSSGGFSHTHARARVPYYEEYPFQPTGVINGFMAALFGLFELATWLDHAPAGDMFRRGVLSLEAMLPYYTTTWWSLYDLDPESPIRNVNSPRYHVMTTDYLRVLSAISGNQAIARYRDRWSSFNRWANRSRAMTLKTFKKIVHR